MRAVMWVLVLGAALGLGSCRKADVRKVVVRVPELKTAKDIDTVTQALKKTKGILAINVDTNDTVLVVTYDSLRLAKMNVEHVIAEAGYAANETPPYPQKIKAER